MTVLEVIQKSSDFLAKKGVDSARLQTELLLAHVLKLPRMKLYLNFERKLSDTELDSIRELVKRRGQREPLQHITGSTSFCGFEMAVNRHVLVPRPETELLAEMGWEFLNVVAGILPAVESGFQPGGKGTNIPETTENSNRVTNKHANPGGRMPPSTAGETPAATALDFGTGSGCIAIALAVKCPATRVVALDVSAEALVVAKQNAERNGVAERVEFVHGDGFGALSRWSEVTDEPNADCSRGRSPHLFDLLISNPPYIPGAEIATLQPEVRDFDPRGALDGGADGLDFYRMLAAQAGNFLKPDGKLMLEFGDGQADEIKKIFESQKWVVEAVREDYTRRPRILVARRNS